MTKKGRLVACFLRYGTRPGNNQLKGLNTVTRRDGTCRGPVAASVAPFEIWKKIETGRIITKRGRLVAAYSVSSRVLPFLKCSYVYTLEQG